MTPAQLQHTLVPFSGHRDFVTAAIDTVRTALAAGATPVVLARTDRLADIRAELGVDADAMMSVDRSIAGRNPARLLPALQQHVDAATGPVHCIGEVVRADDPAAVLEEMALHELMLQLPRFQGWDCRLLCAHDRDLPGDVLDAIDSSHRRRADPADVVDRVRATALSTRPSDSEELGVDRTTLSALRGFIEGRAAKAGLGEERVDDLVYAVNEVVTNSICHGEGRARVSFWTDEASVTCEVRDRGWIRDPLAGRVAPDPDRVSGRGLWLVNQLCDLVQLRSSPAGTMVRLHVDA